MSEYKNLIFRPIGLADTDSLLELMKLVGEGMMLEAKLQAVVATIERSLLSFNQEEGLGNFFLFCLADVITDRVIGISAVIRDVGPFATFVRDGDFLVASRVLENTTEIGYLALNPAKARYYNQRSMKVKYSTSRFLSLSRFLFISNSSPQFSNTIFAEIRSFKDRFGGTPFYDLIWRKYFDGASYEEVDRLVLKHGHQILMDLPPVKNGVDIKSFTNLELSLIGKPHDVSVKALGLLESINFDSEHNSCDMLGGGPHLACSLPEIKPLQTSLTLATSQVVNFKNVKDDPESPWSQWLISNCGTRNFRAASVMGRWDDKEKVFELEPCAVKDFIFKNLRVDKKVNLAQVR